MARPAAGPARRGQVFGGADVVLRRPLTLVSSSPGTTSDGRIGARGQMAWCFATRKPLFLRRRAPRRMGESAFGTGWRGASPPANPCFFVEGHHVIGPGRAFREAGVVLHRPLALVSSSRGTTPLVLVEPSEEPAWCFTARKPLFLRRRAPRRMGESEHGDGRRGLAFGGAGVVPHRPQSLVSSSPGTTPLISSNRTIPGTRPGFPEFPSPPKNEKCRPRCCSRSTLPTFPFPLSISRDCPSLHIEGTVSILSYPILSYPILS